MNLDLAPRRLHQRRAVPLMLVGAIACLSSFSGYCFAAHDTPRMGLAEAMHALETDLHPEHRDAMVAVVRDRIAQALRTLRATPDAAARAALDIVHEESR